MQKKYRTRLNAVLTASVMMMFMGCQSGGGNAEVKEPSESVTSDCWTIEGSPLNCNAKNMYCFASGGQCVECLNSRQCGKPEAPICSQNKCVPCSEQNACEDGICLKNGTCVECVNNSDCTSNASSGIQVDGLRTVCVENQCVACNAVTCLGTCADGICIEDNSPLCTGTECGQFSPTEFSSIAPLTRDLASQIRFLHVDIADLQKKETAPYVKAYKVDAVVNGIYATVTTEFVIHNPNHRDMEGELEFPLPDDAVVSGYAIDIDGMMTDAQVVEKERARMAYESEVKKGIDPGFVEQIKGNAYRTQIYPIPANSGRRVRVEYVTPLMMVPNGDAALALPMPNVKLDRRDIVISVAAQGISAPAVGGLGDKRFAQAKAFWVVESHETDVKPGENVLVAMPNLPETIVSTESFKGDKFFMASVKAAEPETAAVLSKKYRLIWDASGSRTSDDIAKALDFIGHLPEKATYELHVFRNVLEPVQTFGSRDKLLSTLGSLAYDGGTDFSSLDKLAARKFNGITLFFTDGMDTMNGALPQFGTRSIAIMTGNARDVSSMRNICGGRVVNLDIIQGDDAVRQIQNAPVVIAALNGNGFDNVEGIDKASAGRVTIVGRVDSKTSNASIVLSNGKKIPIQIPAEVTEGKTIASAWAAYRIDELSPKADDNREELLALGRKFSIASPVTSFLVLENLDQWLEYDIEPPKNSPLHARWLEERVSEAERRLEKEEEEQKWAAELSKLWDMRVAWYNSPKVKLSDEARVHKYDPKIIEIQLYPESPNEDLKNYCVKMVNPEELNRLLEQFEGRVIDSELNSDGLNSNRVNHVLASKSRSSSQPRVANRVLFEHNSTSSSSRDEDGNVDGVIEIQDWNPDTPYLQAVKDAYHVYKSDDAMYKEYLKQRKEYAISPAFYLDCAHLFFNENKKEYAVRILSNLAELKIDDVGLLRVYAWRLREADELDNAILILRKVAKLRPDEVVSWRDLAMTLTMRAKKNNDVRDAQEALNLYHKVIFNSWNNESYDDIDDLLSVAVVALEEFNELISWCKRKGWLEKKISVPKFDPKFMKNFESDLRIVVSWDSDNTDIDLMISEPSGEKIYYNNKCSLTGGILGYDIIDGYGPEEYIHKYAPKGKYSIYANYFASHEQRLIGAATITVIFYSNWGRSSQKSKTVTYRLDKVKDKFKVGEYTLK